MSFKATKPGSVYFCLSIVFIVLFFIRATFLYCYFKLVCVLAFGCFG